MHIIIGLVMIIAGFIMVIGTETVLRIFGGMEFAEKFFRTSGGSRMIYKYIGIGVIFFGTMIILNMHTSILEWIARNLFGAYGPAETVQEEYLEVR